MKERLQKAIARAGVASRRKAEELMRAGRVSVNDALVRSPGVKVDLRCDRVVVDGVELNVERNLVYVLLHKPAGCICSASDPQGRHTVMDLVAAVPEWILPVGRLDYDTEGLLVMTNDGQFSQILQHPRYRVPRTYLVKVRGVPGRAVIQRLCAGIELDGVRTHPAGVCIVRKTRLNSWIEVVLHEGRNRQIKKMFEQIGHPTLRIIRTEFGPLRLGDLPTGAYRFLKRTELEGVRQLAHTRPPTDYRSRVT